MPEVRSFLESAPARPFRGVVYRICSAGHLRTLLSMRGAYLHGGRYSIREYFGALYKLLRIEE